MKISKVGVPFLLGCLGGIVSVVSIDYLSEKDIPNTPQLIVSEQDKTPIAPITLTSLDKSVVSGNIDLREAARNSIPAVVHVKTIQMGREYIGNPILDYWFGATPRMREYPQNMGSGSGVIISEDGYIVTNNHVIEGSDAIRVILNDKREFDAKIIGNDPATDIALLKIDASNLSVVSLGDSDNVELGEWVLAVGNPYNLTSTVTAGIISAKSRHLGGQMGLESFLQTDAAVNPGNSGGALVNAKGELIGINTAIQSPTGSYSGYSFAVPINIAKKVVNDLKRYGKVQRAVLGVRMGELTPAYADELKLNVKSGIYIVEVIKDGAAYEAGLKEGDVITKINGVEVKTSPQFQEQLVRYNPGEKIRLTINRKDKLFDQSVTLQNSYGNTSLLTKSSGEILGVTIEPLSKNERYRYRLEKGVLIKKIENGKFKSAGLTAGYIIVKINHFFISNEEDLRRALNSVGNEGVFVTAMSPRGRVEYFAFSLTD